MVYLILLYPFLLYPIPALLYPILLYLIPLYQIPILPLILNSVMTNSPKPASHVRSDTTNLCYISGGSAIRTATTSTFKCNEKESPHNRIYWPSDSASPTQCSRSPSGKRYVCDKACFWLQSCTLWTQVRNIKLNVIWNYYFSPNSRVAELLDYSCEELTGSSLYRLCHVEDVHIIRKTHEDRENLLELYDQNTNCINQYIFQFLTKAK